jgi:hypothetical protein
MPDTKSFDILKVAVQLLVGLLGALLGSGIAWGVTQQKMADFERRITSSEIKIEAVNTQLNEKIDSVNTQANTDRVYVAGQLGEIKAKLDTALNRN